MKIPRIVWPLAGVALVAAFGVAAGGGPDAPPPAADLARFAGCDRPNPHPASMHTRESATCREAGYDVEAATFDDNAQRDHWVDGEKAPVVLSGFGGGTPLTLVAGDRWAVVTGDPSALARLRAAANGWPV